MWYCGESNSLKLGDETDFEANDTLWIIVCLSQFNTGFENTLTCENENGLRNS